MKITILGGGFIGLTTAYMLSKNPEHEITLIERHNGPAEECSFANGAQLSYCHAEPWAGTETILKAMKWLGQKDSPLLFRPLPDLEMWKWIARFLSYCNKKTAIKNTEKILNLGLYSRKVLHEIESELDFGPEYDWDYRKGGKIFAFYNEKEFLQYKAQAKLQTSFGSEHDILSQDEIFEFEPCLKKRRHDAFGYIRDSMDESAMSYEFSVGLSDLLKKKGVKLVYGESIKILDEENGKISKIVTDKNIYTSDLYIMCLGAYSPVIAKQAGLKLPVWPIKGYSITMDITNPENAPRNSITIYDEKVVYSKIKNQIRAAGTAEFAGYNHNITDYRIEMLKRSTRKNFDDFGDVNNATGWACLRPATPDSVPVLGKCKIENMILNTGHGTLGWTQNFASAKMIADLVEGKQSEIDINEYALSRFEKLF